MDNSNTAVEISKDEGQVLPDGSAHLARSAADAALVTNTESSTTCENILRLQVPSLLAFNKFSERQKRYVLQSVNKEILGACSRNDDGTKSKYYRFGACKQLSTAFRPDDFKGNNRDNYELLKNHRSFIEDSISKAAIGYRVVDGAVQAHYSGLCNCNSVWICPVCGPIVSEYRAKEIAQAMYKHQSEGGFLLFVTFTVRHKKKHKIRETLDCLTKSIRSLKTGNQWTLFQKRTGFVGSIHAPEYTFTDSNGHHPHRHELWFLDEKPDVKAIKKWIFDRYSGFVVKHEGFDAPSFQRGVDIRLCLSSEQQKDTSLFDPNEIHSVASYLSKGADTDKTLSESINHRSWGVPEELTKNQYKKVKRTTSGRVIQSYNSTAMSLDYMISQSMVSSAKTLGLSNDQVSFYRRRASYFASLYRDYADAFFGKRQLFWSPGLKDRFDIYEMEDSSVVDSFEGELEELMSLNLEHLQKIVRFRLRSRVLGIVENPKFKTNSERKNAVVQFLDSHTDDNHRTDRYG